MRERWKDIQGFEGYYQVSNCGRVRSMGWVKRYGKTRGKARFAVRRTFVGTVLSTGIRHSRYIHVTLSKNGRHYHRSVHRLVALAFIPNPAHLSEVHHKDSNKHNNAASNLQWVTRKRNAEHMSKSSWWHKYNGFCDHAGALEALAYLGA
jgi:hypothetical protein